MLININMFDHLVHAEMHNEEKIIMEIKYNE